MATVGTTYFTMSDWAKRADPEGNGVTTDIVEIQAEENPWLDAIPILEGNLPTGHRITRRASLPTVGFRQANYGVAEDKSTTKQVDETCARIEGRSSLDEMIADIENDRADVRLTEDAGFIQSMSQLLSDTLLYGNAATDPEQFTGLAPRYNSTSDSATGSYILDASGSGADITSMWLLNMGPRSVFGFFPKGQAGTAGIQTKDLGLVDVRDSNSRVYRAWQTQFVQQMGLAVKDYRQIVRIANIDVSDLKKDAASGADIVDLLIQATHKIWSLSGTPMILCNRTIMSILDRQTLNQSGTQLMYGEDIHGRKVMTFRGIPIYRTDSILDSEAVVS